MLVRPVQEVQVREKAHESWQDLLMQKWFSMKARPTLRKCEGCNAGLRSWEVLNRLVLGREGIPPSVSLKAGMPGARLVPIAGGPALVEASEKLAPRLLVSL